MGIKIGLIGGSGLDRALLFTKVKEISLSTRWGEPSSVLREGMAGGISVVQLSRHGFNHNISPGRVNYLANIEALKLVGCNCILATTAAGSLRQEIMPGDLLIPDQFIDFTKQRKMTYFEDFADGSRHTSMPDPFDLRLRNALIDAAASLNFRHHKAGTVVTIEGPRFSTRAESRMFRILGADIINMSISTEAILANELEIPYACVAMITDYDSWNEEHTAANWQDILEVFHRNADNVIKLLLQTVPMLARYMDNQGE